MNIKKIANITLAAGTSIIFISVILALNTDIIRVVKNNYTTDKKIKETTPDKDIYAGPESVYVKDGTNNLNLGTKRIQEYSLLKEESKPKASNQDNVNAKYNQPQNLAQPKNIVNKVSVTEQFFMIKNTQISDKASNKGAYYVDPNIAYSPQQLEDIKSAGDKYFSDMLVKLAVENYTIQHNSNPLEDYKVKKCRDYNELKISLRRVESEMGTQINSDYLDKMNSLLNGYSECY